MVPPIPRDTKKAPRARSHAEAAMRVSGPVWAQERAEVLTALVRISLNHVEPEASDPLVVLERFSLTRVAPISGQEEHPVTASFLRAAKSVARLLRSAGNWAWTALVRGESSQDSSRDLESTSLSRDGRTVAPPDELDKLSLSASEPELLASDPARASSSGAENPWSASFPPTSLD